MHTISGEVKAIFTMLNGKTSPLSPSNPISAVVYKYEAEENKRWEAMAPACAAVGAAASAAVGAAASRGRGRRGRPAVGAATSAAAGSASGAASGAAACAAATAASSSSRGRGRRGVSFAAPFKIALPHSHPSKIDPC
jgi:hypothetical protein